MAKNSNTYKTFDVNVKTPNEFYKILDDEFNFTLDPCPLDKNPKINGLMISWGMSNFINPPYGKAIKEWLLKGLEETKKGKICVFLLPAYTDVKWFHEIVLPNANEIRFIKGRLKFGEHRNSAPFASMVVIFK